MTWLAGRQLRWPTPRLKDVADVINGYPFSSDGFNDSVGIPLIRIRDLADHSPQTYFDGDVPAESIVQPGDLLIGMDGDFNSAIWRGPRAALNQRMCKLVAGPGLDQRFLAYFVDLPLRAINEITYFTTVKHLSSVDLMNEVIPLPPLAEQRAIADYLDVQTARIDALIAKKQQLIHLLEERLNTGVRSLVTGGSALGPKWEPAATWVGPVPMGWRPMKIAWHKRTGSGTTPRSDQPGMYEGGSTPWVTTAELREARIDSTVKRVSSNALTEYSALTVFPAGTLLVAMYGATVGRLGVLGVPATTNQACCAIYGEGDLNQEFLYWWLRAFRSDLVNLAYGAGQPNISQETIRSLRVPAPPKNEQQDIVRSCTGLAARLDATGRTISRQLELLAEHRQALITAAVTGEFAVPGAA